MKTLPIASAAVFLHLGSGASYFVFKITIFSRSQNMMKFSQNFTSGEPRNPDIQDVMEMQTLPTAAAAVFLHLGSGASYFIFKITIFQQTARLYERTDVKVRSFAMPLYVSAARVNPLIAKMTFNVTFNLQHLHLMCLAKCTYLWAECVDNVQ